MFREEYIKANEEIKPSEEFLARLKETVALEDKVIQIGEYVNLEDITSIAEFSNESMARQKVRKNLSWKNVAMMAACFIFVFFLSFVASKIDILNDNQGIQAGMEDAFADEKDIPFEGMDDTQLEQQYQLVQDMFSKKDVIIYEVSDFSGEKNGMQYLQELYGSSYELGKEERDELVGAIVAGTYMLKPSLEELDAPIYYVAEFDDHTFVYFVVDNNGYIHIVEISGIQSLAKL